MGGSGNWGVMASEYVVSFEDDENVPELVVMVIHPYKYTKNIELDTLNG